MKKTTKSNSKKALKSVAASPELAEKLGVSPEVLYMYLYRLPLTEDSEWSEVTPRQLISAMRMAVAQSLYANDRLRNNELIAYSVVNLYDKVTEPYQIYYAEIMATGFVHQASREDAEGLEDLADMFEEDPTTIDEIYDDLYVTVMDEIIYNGNRGIIEDIKVAVTEIDRRIAPVLHQVGIRNLDTADLQNKKAEAKEMAEMLNFYLDKTEFYYLQDGVLTYGESPSGMKLHEFAVMYNALSELVIIPNF